MRIKEVQIIGAGGLRLVTVVARATLGKVVEMACGTECDNNYDGDGGGGSGR